MGGAGWSILSHHGAALVYVSEHRDARLREIAAAIGVSVGTAQIVVSDLRRAGYVRATRVRTWNVYEVNTNAPPVGFTQPRTVKDLLSGLVESSDRGQAASDLDLRSTAQPRNR